MRHLERGAKLLRRLARLCPQRAVRLSDTDEVAQMRMILREGDTREIACTHLGDDDEVAELHDPSLDALGSRSPRDAREIACA